MPPQLAAKMAEFARKNAERNNTGLTPADLNPSMSRMSITANQQHPAMKQLNSFPPAMPKQAKPRRLKPGFNLKDIQGVDPAGAGLAPGRPQRDDASTNVGFVNFAQIV